MVQFIAIFILIFTLFFNQDIITKNINSVSSFMDNEFKTKQIQVGLSEEIPNDILVYFCPKDDCFFLLYETIRDASNEVKCAFYELDDRNFSSLFLYKHNQGLDVEIIIDGDYENEKGIVDLYSSSVKIYSDGKRSKFMHNKFCVIDDKIVITGSTNPTQNGFYYNNNNMIKIESTYLAKNYENEFNQMREGNFGSSKKSSLEYNDLNLSFQNQNYQISNYFCPKDNCADEIVKILESAQFEILFANFVLTNNDIEKALIEKNKESINITGIIESRMWNSQGSIVTELSSQMSIVKDTNPKTMHHKVFVVDSKYVITGSMNPTGSGDEYNDENILIIENNKIANLYKEEILTLFENN